MKFLLIILTIVNTGCVLAVPPKMKFTLKVIDLETKQSITNALVWTGFTQKEDPWGIGVGKSYIIEEKIGSKGIATYSGNSVNGGHGGSVFAEGYYYSGFDFKYKTNKILNRWEPWNPTITVKLRPKKDPVPMRYKQIKSLKVSVFNKPVGFDLEVGDWVAPYGKGKIADFIFLITSTKTPKKGVCYKLVFSNPDDGIQEYEFPKNLDSSFKWLYLAPLSGYQSSLKRFAYYRFPNPTVPSTNIKKDINYIFRIRSKRNKKGEIVSACYGRIKGDLRISKEGLFYFQYWFNPNPKSRSLESKNKPY